jgi:hypothetical protein
LVFHCTKSSCNLEDQWLQSIESNDFDADWGELDHLVDLPPGTGDIHLHCAGFANNWSGSS